MIESLYRGKTLDTGKWVEGFYVRLNGKEHRIYTGYAETDCGDYYPDYFTVDPETIGQYVWMKDNNGTKVFTGDILLSLRNTLSVVKYGKFMPLMFYDMLEKLYPKHKQRILFSGIYATSIKKGEDMFIGESPVVTVIGNVYDNPELLQRARRNVSRTK